MFRTPVSLEPVNHPLTLSSKILSVGSCFADFMGNRLARNKFKIVTNPFGIIFHPMAQFQVLKLALSEELPPENSYVKNQGIWYNYLYHSSVSAASLGDLEHQVGRRISEIRTYLDGLDYLFLTFGTAIQYQVKETEMIVANCHKLPQDKFEKSLSFPHDILHAFTDLCSVWGNSRPPVILSVSPIRHIKEGIERNALSKSVLRVACELIINNHTETSYFPGFEIMMDDLRDYRFFEKDMIHPNDTARDYIWDMFISNYLDKTSRDFITKWHQISRNLAHRPFHPNSAAHQEFLNKTLKLIEQLPEHIDTSKEIMKLRKALK